MIRLFLCIFVCIYGCNHQENGQGEEESSNGTFATSVTNTDSKPTVLPSESSTPPVQVVDLEPLEKEQLIPGDTRPWENPTWDLETQTDEQAIVRAGLCVDKVQDCATNVRIIAVEKNPQAGYDAISTLIIHLCFEPAALCVERSQKTLGYKLCTMGLQFGIGDDKRIESSRLSCTVCESRVAEVIANIRRPVPDPDAPINIGCNRFEDWLNALRPRAAIVTL